MPSLSLSSCLRWRTNISHVLANLWVTIAIEGQGSIGIRASAVHAQERLVALPSSPQVTNTGTTPNPNTPNASSSSTSKLGASSAPPPKAKTSASRLRHTHSVRAPQQGIGLRHLRGALCLCERRAPVRAAGNRTGGLGIVLDGRLGHRKTLVCNRETDEERKDGTARGASNAASSAPILRANIDIPPNQTPTSRTNIQTFYAPLPDPINLQLYPASQTSPHVPCPGAAAKGPSEATIVAGKFHEAMGLSLGRPGHRAFVADLNGSMYGRKEVLIEDAGTLMGIVHCEA
ncbi:hypothetical protein FIBSPDRAFT_894524 [Athelia psychrophila]|uniref:Uncharacterized protein n=1 Tax=Athelia psychrophila TaxID=1759441 RepID=A0A166FSN5_9AGAM|nr:hypothetical protein FIBSPDRAFT_894524 [Fibularhizoctonia sp. CBS 109695]